MKHETRLGSRIAEVHNGSSLFTGDAGQGESNIRRWIIENDWLEAIVALPLNMFYNTGIATYIWVLGNRKPVHRQGRVQLIDASQWSKPLRKNLGKKNCEFAEDDTAVVKCAHFHGSEIAKPIPSQQTYAGTLDVIRLCREAGLPPPDFQQRGNQFVATLWRDWLTPETLAGLGLNPRQRKALELLRQERRIGNARYRELTGASSPTAKRDLEDLVGKGLLTPRGAGRGAYYELAAKRLGIGSIGSGDEDGNGS